VARALGASLARVHDAGFEHPDLYAQHVLVCPEAGTVHLLDWQRTRRRRGLGWRARGRGLAALDATLDGRLVSPGERLAFLRAYLEGAQQHPEEAEVPGQPAAPAAPRRMARLRLVLEGLRGQSRRLLARRHVREKRQPPAATQAWECLDGAALCVTPAFQERCPQGVPGWLPLEQQPAPAREGASRRWLDWQGARTLLVRRRQRAGWAALWSALRGRPFVPRQQAEAALLLRLERHAVPAPRVLALGQRPEGAGGCDSFLLTEELADTVALEVWLRRQSGRPMSPAAVARRRDVLGQAGALVRRLHEATCYLKKSAGGCGLAVRLAPGGRPAVVLAGGPCVRARRRQSPGRERRDLARLEAGLAAAGCGRADRLCFRAGYGGSARLVGPPLPAGPSQAPAPLPRPPAAGPPAARPVPPRGGRETLWDRLVRGVCRFRQRSDWTLHAGPGWPGRIMEATITDRYYAKQGRSIARWVLPAPPGAGGRGLAVYLKRHHRLPWWQGWLATLWPGVGWSPALAEWRHLRWAQRQGVPVPAVVAAAEYIGPWGRLQSFLAVEELEGMIPVHEAVPLAAARMDARAFRRWKRTLATEMARLARMLHDRRCFHKDLYLCHFYVARADTAGVPAGGGWRGRVFLIDLHRLAHHPWTWRLWQLKDLAQLLFASEMPGIDARDRLWFWRAYRGTGPLRAGDRWLRRGVWLKWQRYRRHNARHRRTEQGGGMKEEKPTTGECA
jgi:heptose I phosphotransferase